MMMCLRRVLAAEEKTSRKPLATLCRRAGDDQPVDSVIRRERGGGIDAAIFRVGQTHSLNRLRIDAFRLEYLVGPTRDDMRNKPLGVLSGGLAIPSDRCVDQHGFA